MKKLFSTTLPASSFDFSMMVLRVLVGSFMLTHGIPKLEYLTAGNEIKFADPFGLGPSISLALAVLAEFIGSCCIILGLATRIASVFLMITMLVAAFHAHGGDPFSRKEQALLYAIIYFLLIVFGSGRYSGDRLIERR